MPAAYFALTTAAMVWGGSIVLQKFALRYFSPIEVSVLRGAGALLILVPLWWWQERRAVRFTARDAGVLAALSLGVLGNHILTLLGLRYIGAGAAGIIIGACPVITALLSSLFIRDVPLRSVIGGCAVSFAGVALIAGAEQTNVGSAPWLGGMLILMGLCELGALHYWKPASHGALLPADGQLDDIGVLAHPAAGFVGSGSKGAGIRLRQRPGFRVVGALSI